MEVVLALFQNVFIIVLDFLLIFNNKKQLIVNSNQNIVEEPLIIIKFFSYSVKEVIVILKDTERY